jgi:hypothetical protein
MASSQSTSSVTIPALADDEEVRRLARVFGLDPGADDVREQLAPWLTALASAATREYILAFTGTRAPGTMRELRELRLRLLYDNLEGDAPTDAQVAQLFGLTPSQARNLIAGTRARYRPELERTMSSRSIAALKKSTRVDDRTARVVMSDSLAVYLGDLISETQAPPLEKVKDASSTYDIKKSTATALGKRLGFEIGELKGFQQENS